MRAVPRQLAERLKTLAGVDEIGSLTAGLLQTVFSLGKKLAPRVCLEVHPRACVDPRRSAILPQMPPEPQASPSPRPWWVTALIAALVTAPLVALGVYFIPLGRGTVVLAASVLVFLVVLLNNPAYWRRRLSGACIARLHAPPRPPGLCQVALFP